MAPESFRAASGSRAADTVPSSASSVPPSSVEVVVRTLASDIEVMGKGGGTFVAPERISIPTNASSPATVAPPSVSGYPGPEVSTPLAAPSVSQPSLPVENAPVIPQEEIEVPKTQERSPWLLYTIGGVVGAGILFAIGFFVYPFFVSDKTPPAPITPPPARSTTTPPVIPPPPGGQVTGAEHKSFFAAPSQLVIWNVDAATGTLAQSLSVLAQTASLGIPFIEVVPQAQDGSSLDWIELAPRLQAVLAQRFFQENFESDFTMFVYREGKRSWPGYLLRLVPGKLPILLQKEALKIESVPSAWTDLFLDPPGTPSGTFKDGQINGQPVRVLSFSSGPTFLYGWFGAGYFAMSTSEEGLKEAARRL